MKQYKGRFTLTGFADEISPMLDEQMAGIKGLGMSHIEMRGVDGKNLSECSIEEVKAIKKRLDTEGISLSAIGSPIGKINITDDFAPHFELFKHVVEEAQILGTKNIRMFSFYLPGGEEEHRVDENPEEEAVLEELAAADGTSEHSFESTGGGIALFEEDEEQELEKLSQYEGEVMERLGRFVDYAKANEIVLLHENEKGIYGAKAPACVRLMKEFYGPNFKAIFDFANFVQVHQRTRRAYHLLKDYIAYVHIKDARWKDGEVVPAGSGDGHVEEILKALAKRGYEGYLSLEPHLAEFQGFAALEQDGKIEAGRKLTGLEAFTLAHDSLLAVLEKVEK